MYYNTKIYHIPCTIIYHIPCIPCTIMQKSNQKIAMLYCMVIGTAKAFLKHMFLACCITTRLTKCSNTESVLTQCVLIHLSSSFSTNLNMLFIAASADNLAFFVSYLVSTKLIKKLLI